MHQRSPEVQRHVVGLQIAVVEHDHLIGSASDDVGIGESVIDAPTTHGDTLDPFIVTTTSDATTDTDSTYRPAFDATSGGIIAMPPLIVAGSIPDCSASDTAVFKPSLTCIASASWALPE